MALLGACTGPLPHTVALSTRWALHHVGCSFSPASAELEILLCLETLPRAPSTAQHTHFLQHPLPTNRRLRMVVAGCHCKEPRFLQHVVSVRCRCVPAAQRWQQPSTRLMLVMSARATIVADDGLHGVAAKSDFAFRIEPRQMAGRLLACTGRLVHGNIGERRRLVTAAQTLWQAVGFASSMLFARSASECDQLRLADAGVTKASSAAVGRSLAGLRPPAATLVDSWNVWMRGSPPGVCDGARNNNRSYRYDI